MDLIQELYRQSDEIDEVMGDPKFYVESPLLKRFWALVGHIAGWAVVSGIAAIPLVLLWNWIIPGLLGLPILSYLQTIGLLWIVFIISRFTGDLN